MTVKDLQDLLDGLDPGKEIVGRQDILGGKARQVFTLGSICPPDILDLGEAYALWIRFKGVEDEE